LIFRHKKTSAPPSRNEGDNFSVVPSSFLLTQAGTRSDSHQVSAVPTDGEQNRRACA